MPDDPMAGLRMGLLEYAAFGLENPNEYRVVFMTRALHADDAKTFREIEAKNPALQCMLESVATCIKAGHLKGDVHAIATILWTLVHGAISLLISFPFYPFGDPTAYCEKIVDLAISTVRDNEVDALVEPERLS